ncbi:MAG: UDP-N-acetylglucosamine--N-acetylmuramyl-(pentapeptide) pyrophosphoryl-undecaprenol N-acetylglucosamine transferase [Patescibacteria group bacterium]|jgi:UDP-N-acetylglucosamine--N-acetylmuramyl-(pentapeptide) pyrophosphoryl-undecaprenol N-acetylglucosamine transferase
MDGNKVKKIMFSGGGTGGSVVPLLAVAEKMAAERIDFELKFVFVGAAGGIENDLVAEYNGKFGAMEFIPLSAGKLRRYFSWQNFWDMFKIVGAFFQSLRILSAEKPDIVISAGSFISVPLVWAAAWKKIPILIHQQDVRPGLANKLMAPFARVITVVFEKSLTDYGSRAVWTGNPFKSRAESYFHNGDIRSKYGFDVFRPLVLVIGGSSGATAINKLFFEAGDRLVSFCQIIHITGKGKITPDRKELPGYKVFEFLDNEEFLKLMVAADLVVSRCGLAALTELSSLAKPAILIPMPDSHQEDNAKIFDKAAAASVLDQKELNPEKLTAEIKRVLDDSILRGKFSDNIAKVVKRGAAENLAMIIEEIIGK